MTFYTFEVSQTATAIQNVNGTQEENVVFTIANNALFTLMYARLDGVFWTQAASSGECGARMIVQYFFGDPPIASVAEVTSESFTNFSNGIRFVVDKYKDFNLIDGIYLRGGDRFSTGLQWFGAPPGVAIEYFATLTIAFDLKGNSNGQVIKPEVVYHRELKEVTISAKNPTREVPTA